LPNIAVGNEIETPGTQVFKVAGSLNINMNVEKLREDFPVLQKKINGKPIIYFDSACMSLKPKQVIQKMNESYEDYTACAGRSAHQFGTKLTAEYENAREIVAKSIGGKKEEVVFTRNTTEGINLVANSLDLKKGDTVLTTDREHNSNLIPWQVLAERNGIKHKVVLSKKDMTFDLENFKKCLDKSVKLVSFVHSSNLDGYTLPVKEIIKMAHENGSLVMLDGAQSMPHKKLSMKDLDVDFFTFSGHKMLGPYGTGVLFGKFHLLEKLKPFMTGGETVEKTTYDKHWFLKPPHKFEAGLQNYGGSIGLAAACEYLDKVGKENIQKHEIELNEIITRGVDEMEGVTILGPHQPELRGGCISFVVDKMNYHDVALMLDRNANIMVRSGQHCVHSWFNAHNIEGSARVSLYLYNTKDEAEIFIEELSKIIKLR
jgi:cysteine desulfurase/selenocysteine lyase